MLTRAWVIPPQWLTCLPLRGSVLYMTNTATAAWTTIGKDAHSMKVPAGFYHVMKVGARVWSVTLNGRVIGTAKTGDEGKTIAEAHR